MAAPLLCDDQRSWVAVDQQVTSTDFQALTLAIQGLGLTHEWLRKIEHELAMNAVIEEHDKELYLEYRRTWSSLLYDRLQVQPAFYFAMYRVKSLLEVTSIIRNERGIKGENDYRKTLNDLAGALNIIRQPLAKHQVEGGKTLSFPKPILVLGDENCFGWEAVDKNGQEHRFSGVNLAEHFIKAILEK
jgi:hypothetical protein